MSCRLSCARRAGCTVLACVAVLANAGPVEIYREGPRYYPRDRDPNGIAITEAQAIDRARTLLPADFCGPTRFVSGCDVLPEYANGSWRIYFHQFQMRDGKPEWAGSRILTSCSTPSATATPTFPAPSRARLDDNSNVV